MAKKGKGGGGADSKAAQKAKQKKVDDMTFGLKNKKGKKNQQFIAQVQQQVQGPQRKKAAADTKQKVDKASKIAELEMMNELFKPVAQTVKKGEDPKSVVCEFYRKGLCKKGDKCKFSHDISKDRKGAKRNAYADAAEGEGADENDTMDKWDQEKLEDVVNKKHAKEKAQPKTDIICKHFLEALDKNLYGWFWVCPGGGDDCKYRHVLPPGYILKKDRKAMEAEENQLTIEELVERERAALGTNLTKVTLESFTAWKKKKLAEKRKKLKMETSKKRKNIKEGNTTGVSGRELFELNPDAWGADDDEAADFTSYVREKSPTPEDSGEAEGEAAEGEEKRPQKEFAIDINSFRMAGINYDDDDDDDDNDEGDGGAAAAKAGGKVEAAAAPADSSSAAASAAAASPSSASAAAAAAEAGPAADAVVSAPLDASLFAGEENLDDLDDLDDDDDDDE